MVPWGLGTIRWATGNPLPGCHSYPSPIPPSWVSGNSCVHYKEGTLKGWVQVLLGLTRLGWWGWG